ncbi:MAG: hypothetical protein ACE5GA_07210, partial [Candidatus Zixiibacteriota bacterium]
MSKRTRFSLTLSSSLVLLTALSACSSGPINSIGAPPLSERIALSPRDNAEAEEMAVWLSGDTVATTALYEEILRDLQALRARFSESVEPLGRIRFTYPSISGQIHLAFSDTVREMIRNSSYHEWDSLNNLFVLQSIDTSTIRWINPDREEMIATLVFEGRLNPFRVAESYLSLSGVTRANASGLGGDFSNIYPIRQGRNLAFLLREAWGDCPAGCLASHFYYFREIDSGVELVGDLNT